MKSLTALLFGALVLGLSGLAHADDKKDDKKDYEKKILGKWEITKSAGDAPVGTLVEFGKDGKLTVTVAIEKKEIKIEGTYKIEKDQLHTELKVGGETSKDTDTIKELTDEKMVLEDKDKKVTELKKKK